MTDLVLGIETSCDETAASVVDQDFHVHSSVIESSIDQHRAFGGVVPELAGRAHVATIGPVVRQALLGAGLDPLDPAISGIAVTSGPGLIGSLLVGLSAAKAYALAWGVPFVGVNHLEGHLFAPLLENAELEWPLMTLLVSGGHSLIVLQSGPGATRRARRDHRRRRRRGLRQGGALARSRLSRGTGDRPAGPVGRGRYR